MDRIAIKLARQGAPIVARKIMEERASISTHSAGNGLLQDAIDRRALVSTPDMAVVTAEDRNSFLHIVDATAKVTRHYELFLLLQNEVQYFIPHQILISAWGDFHGSRPALDVISAIQGVRTGKINECGIEHALKGLYTRWVDGGRRPMLLDNTDAEGITSTACNPSICTCASNDCALNTALRLMRSVLVHGVRNERDDLDSLYVALNPVSVKNGQSAERFFSLIDPVIAQIDVAFRKVAALKSTGMGPGKNGQRRPDYLSAREQEIVRWIAEGKTNTEIASILGISSFTVKNHAQRIFRKLDASNRTEAVAKYRRDVSAVP